MTTDENRSRFILVGGFLGAGKSTAISRLARMLEDAGERVGLVTNDQSADLVDTALARADGRAVEEIGDGCFCCRFDGLVAASRRLEGRSAPTIYLAEPVGCCTDLVATVGYPLRALHGGDYVLAPLSVVIDPVRARRALGLETGPGFSPDVEYVYGKQLEEAHVIVINKSDLLEPAALEELDGTLRDRFPGVARFTISARRGTGLSPWLDHLLSHSLPAGDAMELDYDRYARGEASLGWLNCTLRADAPRPFDPDRLLLELGRRLHRALANERHQVAHLKMTFAPDDAPGVAVVNLVRNDLEPELARRLERPASAGRLVLNLRAEAAPEPIRGVVEREVEDARGRDGDEYRLRVERLVCFQPARPQPTHRLVRLETGP